MAQRSSSPIGPPMGWNSWDCYGTSVTEAEVLANAEFMAEHLLPFGWDTVVVDIDWSDPTARAHGYNDDAPLLVDGLGRLVPDPVRFPSAADGAGFGPLADRVHGLGLRFGIHIMRGIPQVAVARRSPVEGTDATADEIADQGNRCGWNPDMAGLRQDHPASQAYYDSIVRLYAGWGVDFLKADDMLAPYQSADIEALATAIERSGRGIDLSLSPGYHLSVAHVDHLRAHATTWRISGDLWDRWEDVLANFDRLARWAPYAGQEGWPDADMLPLGRIGIRAERGDPRDSRLTADEARTLMTLWVVARSPLMMGGDLPASSPETIALLTNADVLAILTGTDGNRELLREGDTVVWGAQGEGVRFAAVFNTGDAEREVALDVTALGFDRSPAGPIEELWTGRTVEPLAVEHRTDALRGVTPGSAAVRLPIPAHGAVLLRQSSPD